jgi:hypothetical protein
VASLSRPLWRAILDIPSSATISTCDLPWVLKICVLASQNRIGLQLRVQLETWRCS